MPRFRQLAIALTAALALLLVAPVAANASTYNESSRGEDFVTTSTTLNYSKAHKTFQLRVWVVKSGWLVSDKYSIKMYDRSGRQVWSATNQRDRTYSIGSNVNRIVVKRAAQGASTKWQKR